MLGKSIDEKTIATRLILNSLKIEESLIHLLKSEVKILNKKSDVDIEYAELHKLNKTLRYTIYVITILDDRIQKGLDLLNNSKENDDNK